LYQEYKDVAEFKMIYIKEAHAADGDWPMQYAIEKGIKQQTKYADRCTTAEMLMEEKKLTIPMLVDGIKNEVNDAYSALPDRVFLVRKDGRLGVAGARGPRGFRPALKDVEKWLADFKKTKKEPLLPETALKAAKEKENKQSKK